ncbi:MAG TPA: hypothetical protein VNK45_11085 [Candidatus Acidoferrales bacterium]|nr:hypothetical protein [Candidatus Acidoferrales bacterium]
MSDGEQISQPALQQQADPRSSSGPILSQALRVLRPKRRNLLDGFVDIGDFKTRPAGTIDFRQVWARASSRLTPYCFDATKERVVFVETRDPVDLTEVHPFFYEAQRHHAAMLYAVPYAGVVALAEEMQAAWCDTPIVFLHSTGRCGSTLLCRLLGDAAATVSVSEPDFYSQLVVLRDDAGPAAEARLGAITAACTRLLVAQLRETHPAAQSVVIKLRGMAVFAADLIARDLPDARNLFLYRNAVDTVDSFFAMMLRVPIMRLARKVRLETLVLRLVALMNPMMRNPGALAPLYKDPHYRKQIPEDLAAFLTIAWMSKMQHALALQRRQQPFFQAVLRYEDLCAGGVSMMPELLGALGLPPVDEVAQARMTRTLSRNAQEGSVLASTGESSMNAAQQATVQRMLNLHPEINRADFRLPGTLAMEAR